MEQLFFTEWGAQLRPMQAQDVDQVLAIERRNFRDPWTRRAFLAEIEAAPISQPLVVEYRSAIIGYVVPWFVADEMQIANLAVHEDFRRRGLARQIMAHLCELAQRRRCQVVHLEVKRSNTAARRLYESLGFQSTGARREYYGPDEDALLMSKKLNCNSVESMERKANGLV
ncbi:MAG: ribosomal protein S18-alanine N-acetyltransferase [candidate division KSB1 bacterium]|nr:ribosomal protein S18-alanine N-acetyltransferase [candidate division KSB1 bacterium]MDZ7367883.1 ribosomal protein S18-alanine N-acetyltransferase [candidate division KSB1 bacterium]MDZ7405559.1 ribosomal protein S18-alanine N-acetyltransferase [candidate division KSB1 bacterium]